MDKGRVRAKGLGHIGEIGAKEMLLRGTRKNMPKTWRKELKLNSSFIREIQKKNG